jgi:enoyl-CoA hydratase/carnithine racemase
MTAPHAIQPKHFLWDYSDHVATITLNRPERKNPLTLESYRELTDTFLLLQHVPDVRAVVITGAEENFCSGGDVHDIIGRLVDKKRANDRDALHDFTQMTGDLVKAMRACPQPIIAAVDGICVGAGAILAMASDIRFGTSRSKVAFLFVRVGLSGADMGACAILPRIIGFGRAAELLYLGRTVSGDEAERWGFYNRLSPPESLLSDATAMASMLAHGPSYAHAMTKRCMHAEWSMPIDEAVDYEAEMQADCMLTNDFERAYLAFIEKSKPVFEGN